MQHSLHRFTNTGSARARFGIFLILFLAAGCGGTNTYPVTGKLEFEDGSPVMFGTIELLNRETQLNARGDIARDGSFSISTYQENDGAVAGVHEVTIQQFVTVPITMPDGPEIKHNHGNLVADKYKTYENSDLTLTVKKKGKNEFKLVVQAEED